MRTVDPARHRERRRHIVAAATALFAAKGFDRTTTAEICKAAGMSAGNLFHYFPNKRAIFHAIFAEKEEEEDAADGPGKAARLAAAETAPDPWQGLMEAVGILAEDAAEPLAPALVMEAMVQSYRDPELEALLSRDNAREHEVLTTLVRRATDAGAAAPGIPPSDAATWLLALIGTLYTTAATDPTFHPTHQLPTLHLLITRFLRPGDQPEAPSQPSP